MNDLCKNRCIDILDSFKGNSAGRPNTSAVRCEERYDSHISYFDDWYSIITVEGLQEERYYRIYENSFSRKQNRFDEPGQIVLVPCERSEKIILINLGVVLALTLTASLMVLMLCFISKTSIPELYDFRVYGDFKENIRMNILIIIFHILTPLVAICYWIYTFLRRGE